MAMTFIPTIESDIVLEGMFAQKTLSALMASGVVDLSTLSGVTRGGDTIKLPYTPLPPEFTRVDIGSTVALTPTHVSTNYVMAVVKRDASVLEVYAHDNIRSATDMGAKQSAGWGDRLASRVCNGLFTAAIAGVQALDTSHTVDSHTDELDVQDVLDGKYLVGDEADKLNTLIVPSNCWKNLLQDLMDTYKVDVVAGQVVNNGKLQSIMGISNIIVSDLVPDNLSDYGSGTCGASLICGPNALMFAYQRAVTIENQSNILNPSTVHYVKASFDWVAQMRGVTYNGGVNPTDAVFGASGSYDQSCTDHREANTVLLLNKTAS